MAMLARNVHSYQNLTNFNSTSLIIQEAPNSSFAFELAFSFFPIFLISTFRDLQVVVECGFPFQKFQCQRCSRRTAIPRLWCFSLVVTINNYTCFHNEKIEVISALGQGYMMRAQTPSLNSLTNSNHNLWAVVEPGEEMGPKSHLYHLENLPNRL